VLDGSPVTASPTALFRRGLGRTFQIAKPFPAMTAREAVAVASRPFAHSYREALELATSTLAQVEFAADYDALGADLSNVNRKRLEVARALAGRPKVLLLDEVCAGLSSTEVRTFIEIVRQIAAQDVAIVMVEHVLEAVVALADRVHVLDYGKTIAEGDPATVMASSVVAEAYLGRSAVARRLTLTPEVSS
jgi:branched-chain amino acid transport system ATP-binding protein